MRFPEEIVAERFVPTVRALLARALEKRGLAQTAIAERMGVSQSAVSKHLAGRFEVEPRFADDPRLRAAVERVADGLAAGTMGPVEALAEFEGVVRRFEDRGPICALHEAVSPPLRGLGCDLCVRLGASAGVETERVLASVRDAGRLLAAAPGFAPLVPYVGANVAMGLPGAKDPADVAALPGGLVAFGPRIRPPTAPEFGVSRHLADILLAAHAAHPDVRAAVNVRPEPAFLAAAKKAKLAVVEMPGADERDRAAVAKHVKKRVDVLWHKGDFGVEPIAYVFGADAVAAARAVVRLL